MKKSLVTAGALIALACSSLAVSAQEMLVDEYTMQIDAQDMRNSKGAPLGNFCQIVQQDRANWHRFGKAGPLDSGDSVFHDAGNRQRISQTCIVDPLAQPAADTVMRGQTAVFNVKVYVRGGAISTVAVE